MLILLFVFGLTLFSIICAISFGHKRSKLVKAGLLLACCIHTPLGAISTPPLDLTDPQTLRRAYQSEFGIPPSSDVTNIQCRQVVVGVSGCGWFRFNASPTTIDALLPRFTPCDRDAFLDTGKGGNTPSWWNPESEPIVGYYRAEHWSKSFQNSTAVIGYDKTNQVVYFCHSGFD